MYPKKESRNDRVEEFGEYILSRTVKSVHRTYFLDVRATKSEDLFVSITESRKRQNPDGSQYYDRHKIVLYKEDVLRFCEEFGIVEKFLKEQRPQYFEQESKTESDAVQSDEEMPSFNSDLEFEDL